MRIRVPDSLRDALIAIAEKNGRSLNAEVVARLQETMSEGDDFAKMKAELAELTKKVAAHEALLSVLAATAANVPIGEALDPLKLAPLTRKLKKKVSLSRK
jgi:Arc-like DNA binding domain